MQNSYIRLLPLNTLLLLCDTFYRLEGTYHVPVAPVGEIDRRCTGVGKFRDTNAIR